jgi:hypothetical protein
MARDPGGPLRTQPPGASNGAVEKRGLSSKTASPDLQGDLPRAVRIKKTAAVIEKSPSAGAERQPIYGGRKPSTQVAE